MVAAMDNLLNLRDGLEYLHSDSIVMHDILLGYRSKKGGKDT